MSSELLASGVDNLKGHLAGAFNVLTGSSGDYTDLGIGRKFGGAAAAYSLRDVGAMNGPVVRVRRDSDNSEQDFSALAVPFIPEWCNRQVIKPLDVKALQSDGRTGDFVIAKAAYSLRSLGDRQATIANDAAPLNADTVVPASGKYVIQVRRSSDDTIKSFTADEVTDGTLVAFVGSGNDGFVRAWYDQSVSDQGSTATGNHAVQATAGSQPKIVDSGSLVSLGVDFTGAKFMPFTSISAKTVVAVNQLTDTTNFNYLVGRSGGGDGGVRTGSGNGLFTGADTASSASSDFNNAGGTTHVNGSQSSFLSTSKNVYFGTGTNGFALTALGTAFVFSSVSRSWRGKIAEVIIYDTDQTANRGAFEANIAEHYSISGVPAEDNQVNGLVETWYDQSGNGNNATQTTADNQPKIVSAGSYLGEVDFDGTNDFLDLTSALGITNQAAIFTVAESGGGNDKIILDNRDGGTDGFRVFRFGDAFEYRWQSATVDTGTNPGSGTKFIGFANHDTSNASAAVNGATATAVSDTSSINVTATPRIGARSFTSAANFWDGTINELIVYGADQTSDRANIESNIANHYGITLS